MDDLMIRVEGQVERLVRWKDDMSKELAVLRRENERLRVELARASETRDTFDRRIRSSSRKIESALTRLRRLSEDA